MRGEGLHVNVTEPRAHAARADGPAHRPPADAQADRERHLHHRRRLAAAGAAPAALPDELASAAGQRRGRGRRRARAGRRAGRAHLVGRDRLHRRLLPDRRRVRAVPGLPRSSSSTGFTLSPLFARMLAEQMVTAAPPPSPSGTRSTERRSHRHEPRRRRLAGLLRRAFVTPFTEDGELDLDTLRELLDYYVGEGMHGVVVNGTCGEWFSQTTEERRRVAETAIDASAGRMPVLIGCTDYTAEADRRARAATRSRPAPTGARLAPPPYAKLFPDEIVAFYQDIDAGVIDGPLMVYNWPHGTRRRHRHRAGRPARRHRPRSSRSRTARRTPTSSSRRRGAVTRPGARVRAVHERRVASSCCATEGGDGIVGGGSLWGRPDPEFWEAYWRGDVAPMHAHARRSGRLFPKLWLPGGWAGTVRRLPEPAEGADADARPAGRARPPAAAAGHRPGQPAAMRRCWSRRACSRDEAAGEGPGARPGASTILARRANRRPRTWARVSRRR